MKAAAIQDIEIQKEDITVKFCEGVPIDKETEALVTGVQLQNEAFDIYELQLLGLDKNDSCSYTNSGTATISDTELQELLHTKGLPFPNGIVGQRIKILSNLEMQKEQAQEDILQQLSSSGEELNIDG